VNLAFRFSELQSHATRYRHCLAECFSTFCAPPVADLVLVRPHDAKRQARHSGRRRAFADGARLRISVPAKHARLSRRLEISIKSYSDGYGYPFLRRRNFLDSGGGSTALGQMRKSTKRVNPLEERLLAKRVSVSRTELGSLRRMLVRLQRLLAPEPAAFFAFSVGLLIGLKKKSFRTCTKPQRSSPSPSATQRPWLNASNSFRKNWPLLSMNRPIVLCLC
jgi:hypothetical protein